VVNPTPPKVDSHHQLHCNQHSMPLLLRTARHAPLVEIAGSQQQTAQHVSPSPRHQGQACSRPRPRDLAPRGAAGFRSADGADAICCRTWWPGSQVRVARPAAVARSQLATKPAPVCHFCRSVDLDTRGLVISPAFPGQRANGYYPPLHHRACRTYSPFSVKHAGPRR
jgi:hypothetical protein